MIPQANLDFILAQRNHFVEFRDGEWIWREQFANGNSMIVHGAAPGYTQADAYEDALRHLLNMTPIADEKLL